MRPLAGGEQLGQLRPDRWIAVLDPRQEPRERSTLSRGDVRDRIAHVGVISAGGRCGMVGCHSWCRYDRRPTADGVECLHSPVDLTP
jgi:hypothetical protein